MQSSANPAGEDAFTSNGFRTISRGLKGVCIKLKRLDAWKWPLAWPCVANIEEQDALDFTSLEACERMTLPILQCSQRI